MGNICFDYKGYCFIIFILWYMYLSYFCTTTCIITVTTQKQSPGGWTPGRWRAPHYQWILMQEHDPCNGHDSCGYLRPTINNDRTKASISVCIPIFNTKLKFCVWGIVIWCENKSSSSINIFDGSIEKGNGVKKHMLKEIRYFLGKS